jgi:CRISPR-associated protein Cas1
MPPLYIIQQGAKLRIENHRLVVERDGEKLAHVPLGHISQVVLFGNIGLTTPAIGMLLGEGIEVVFLKESGEFRGRLTGILTPHVEVRRAQYKCSESMEFNLEMAKGFVVAKLEHLRAMLQRRNREEPSAVLKEGIETLTFQIDGVPRKTLHSSLLGVEGAATAAYFGGYRSLFSAEWRFTNRQRRPPPDPVNALLSFGYTLLVEQAIGAVQTAGLDPYLGFLHQLAYNRPALALDLMEEFRPVVDGLVLWCVRGGQITPQDFSEGDLETKEGPVFYPVLLNESGRKRFLLAFEQRMEQTFTHPLTGLKQPMRQCILEQARQVVKRLMNNDPGYTGMGFR